MKTPKEAITKGYKVTDANMQCRGYQFELNKRFKESGTIKVCSNGFHFCELANSCFEYYSFDPKNRVFEVLAYGDIKTEGDKSCTLEIELIRELSWLEVLTLCNSGKDNTGRGNSGYSNSGYRNSGNWNSGDRNSGDSNSGNWNSGDRNSGDRNSGYRNSGDSNSGNWNSGTCNSGNWNSGDRNSGYRNSGDSNSGYSNSGYSNSGYRNSGNRNSGNWNSGDRNSGDSNSGYRNSGAFCTNKNPRLILFDKEVDMTVKEWENHEAVRIMYNIDTTIWVDASMMTPEEKERYPKYETIGGYLKSIPYKEAWKNMWHLLADTKKQVFLDLPGFDSQKFFEITGINVDKEK